MLRGDFTGRGMTRYPSYLIADTVDHRGAQVSLHGANVSGLEAVKTLERVQRSLLHDVMRVEPVACGERQASMRPALERWQRPLKKSIDGLTVSGLSPSHQLHSRVITEQRARIFDIGLRRRSFPLGHGLGPQHNIDLPGADARPSIQLPSLPY
jgi:hypothetical protein